MKKVVSVWILLFLFVTPLFAAYVPNVEQPDFSQSRVVLKSIDTITGNIATADVDEEESARVQQVCSDAKDELRKAVLNREYTAELGRMGWAQCYNAYRSAQ